MRLRRLSFGLGIAATAVMLIGCDNDGICDAGERCGWRDSNFDGSMADWAGDDGNFANEPNGDDAMHFDNGVQDTPSSGDRISSVRNRENVTIWWYADSSCAGDDTPLAANTGLASMPGGGGDVGDNEASAQADAGGC
jgi:hypothetical protein